MIGGSVMHVPPAAPADVSIARLHGEACWWCGAVNTSLAPAGEVSTLIEDGHRVWPVVACSAHRGRDLAGGAPAPAPMQSTPVASTTGRPAYIVHEPGAIVPDTAPDCPPDCPTCGGRP